MSDTPTFANLLTQWTSGGPAGRELVYTHLRNDPAAAAALETSMRDELNADFPANRIIAAEAMLEVYRDEDAAVAALSWVLRQGDPGAITDAVPLVQRLSGTRAVPLISDLVLQASQVLRALPPSFHRWAGDTVLREQPENGILWLKLLMRADERAKSTMLMGLAEVAPSMELELPPQIEPFLRNRLFHSGVGFAAGGALWRLTWRVNRDWLASIAPRSPEFENNPQLLVFVIEVLMEHLGRRPDLTKLVRSLLILLSKDAPDSLQPVVQCLAEVGARGWAVLLPLFGALDAGDRIRAAVFNAASAIRNVLPLAHHHAHAVLQARSQGPDTVSIELLQSAACVLQAIGPDAGSAVPDALQLIVGQPQTGPILAGMLQAIAPGYPNALSAIPRTLDQLLRLKWPSVVMKSAFAALAEAFANLHRDGAIRLVEDISIDSRTLDLLLQQPGWKNAPPEARRQHAIALADRLSSPRAEVRTRAAELLRHYLDQIPAVWPALVALLTSGDEKTVLVVLPYFRHLTPVSESVSAELIELFGEP
ncbi:MAG: hypothetical protein L0241_25520, partial [Planctomycetia bacterium]|nr:hypothetical protein [Planctomycetia bacterium]